MAATSARRLARVAREESDSGCCLSGTATACQVPPKKPAVLTGIVALCQASFASLSFAWLSFAGLSVARLTVAGLSVARLSAAVPVRVDGSGRAQPDHRLQGGTGQHLSRLGRATC